MELIQRAQRVSNILANIKRFDKVIGDYHNLQNGRGTLTLQLLELDPHRIEDALNIAQQEHRQLFTELETYLAEVTD